MSDPRQVIVVDQVPSSGPRTQHQPLNWGCLWAKPPSARRHQRAGALRGFGPGRGLEGSAVPPSYSRGGGVASNVHVGENVHYLALVSPNGDVAFQSFYDVVDVTKSQMVPAELKALTKEIKFKQYRTLIDLDEPTPFVNVAPSAAMTATEAAEKRMDEVEKQLKPLFRRVEDAIAVPKLTGDTNAQHMNLLTLTPPEPQKLVEDSLLVRVALARERWAEDDEVEPNEVFKEGGVIRLAQRGLVPWHSAAGSSSHFSATIHVFPDEDAVKAVKNALEILGGASSKDAAAWAAMEIGGQLGSPMDLTFGVTESEQFKYVYYLLPVVLVFLVLVAQYVM
ncbi:hypothetical protein GQ600_4704 [Phytophthora cactorum]|nr:hypothetical protein GQ600_4704 [Phytophthora cactorum]